MGGLVVTGVPRAARQVVDAFAAYGVATVHEAQGRTGLLGSHLNPVFPGSRIAGTAVTATVAPGDNTTIAVAVEQCREGDIVVAAPTSFSDGGYFGELLASSMAARGVRGLVIEGGCRDVAELTAMRFPVWSRAISAQGTVKETIGSVNIPLVCAGQLVQPGDVIVADDDGVVVVARERADSVLNASRTREEKEEATRKRLQAGELGLDIYGMRDALQNKGLTYKKFGA